MILKNLEEKIEKKLEGVAKTAVGTSGKDKKQLCQSINN